MDVACCGLICGRNLRIMTTKSTSTPAATDGGPLQMVDLVGLHSRYQAELEERVLEVLRSAQYIGGAEVAAFSKELGAYLQGANGSNKGETVHVVPCANGTDALQVALMALGLAPGDEVITTSFTFIATAEVIALLGLTPVLVDVDPLTFNMDVEQARRAVTRRTRVLLPVHLYGQCADMTALGELAQEKGLALVEDTAQAIGSSWNLGCEVEPDHRAAGTMGTIGTTSFFPSKNLGGAGDGGAIFTRDEALAKKMQMICNHGSSRRYHHELIGVNSRLDGMQAALLRVKLRHLDAFNAARRGAADRYDALFGEAVKQERLPEHAVHTPARDPKSTHVFHQYTLKLGAAGQGPALRDGLALHLQKKGIPHGIYYPIPIHRQPAYLQYGIDPADLPVTEDLTHRVISLPMHTELTPEMQGRIVGEVEAYLRGKGAQFLKHPNVKEDA